MTWRQHAACTGADSRVFFPDEHRRSDSLEARTICMSCPVVEQCLDDALTNKEPFGIWGGLTSRDRLRLTRLSRGFVRTCEVCQTRFVNKRQRPICSQSCGTEASQTPVTAATGRICVMSGVPHDWATIRRFTTLQSGVMLEWHKCRTCSIYERFEVE